MIVKFGVRNCKSRGLIIESVDFNTNNVYFFKFHNQQLDGHCVQMQNIIRRKNVKRAQKISIDISEFIHEYYDPGRQVVWFKGIKLESSDEQITKVMTKRINIDVGVKKRLFSIRKKKAQKTLEKQKQIQTKAEIAEKAFQEERARRIHQLVVERKQGLRMDIDDVNL